MTQVFRQKPYPFKQSFSTNDTDIAILMELARETKGTSNPDYLLGKWLVVERL